MTVTDYRRTLSKAAMQMRDMQQMQARKHDMLHARKHDMLQLQRDMLQLQGEEYDDDMIGAAPLRPMHDKMKYTHTHIYINGLQPTVFIRLIARGA